jgi:hypothetical protein
MIASGLPKVNTQKLGFTDVMQHFVRECQRIGFGRIARLIVRDAEPVFSDETDVFLDLKLGNYQPSPLPALFITGLSTGSVRHTRQYCMDRHQRIPPGRAHAGTVSPRFATR